MPDVRLMDGEALVLGVEYPVALKKNTADSDAYVAMIDLPVGGAVAVPVVAVGVRLDNRNLGMFDGLTQPMVAIIDLDHDSYVGFHFSADDTPVIRMRAGGSGTVRNHTIPDVASDTIVLLAATQTLTNKTLTAPTIADFTNAGHDHGDADDGGALASGIALTSPALTTPTITTSVVLTRTALAATTNIGYHAQNTTAAAAGAQQVSPAVRWTGQGWKTDAAAASQAVEFQVYVVPVQGAANPTGYLTWEYAVNGGAYAEKLRLSSDGTLILGVGEGLTTAPTGSTFRAPDAATGGAGNIAGADLTIAAGLGTGTGDEGTIIFSLPIVAAAGDNIQTRATRLTLDMAGSTTVLTMSAAQAMTISTATGALGLTSTDGAVNVVTGSGAADDFTVNTTQFVVEGDTGNVGIGTAAPTKTLHVEKAVGDWLVEFKNTHATTGNGVIVEAGDSNSERIAAFQDKDSTDHVSFYAGGQVVFHTGNVGIGTTTFGTNATFNLSIGGGVTTPVLGTAAADMVHLAAVDFATDDRRFYIQSEVGTRIILGNNTLTLGAAGSGQTGRITMSGATSGTVTLTVAVAAGTWTMTLPTGGGTAGFQLETDGVGVTSWTGAGSRREWKHDIADFTDYQGAFEKILASPLHTFRYRPGFGTGDYNTQYLGIMADESPWATHFGGSIVNPVNTVGYMVAGFRAVNEVQESHEAKIIRLEARVAQLEARLAA